MSLNSLGAAENAGGDAQRKPDAYVRLLGELLSGEYADYSNASQEWRLVMEARIRYIIFTYWVNVEKFKIPSSKAIETRFGELAALIEETGAFKRTFVEPNFTKTAGLFPKSAYVSEEGKRFEIASAEEFEIQNKLFLQFLRSCMAATKNRK